MKKYSPYIFLAVRIFIGLVFSYAGFTKLIEPMENFRGVIAGYEILPNAWAEPLAYGMPWIEVVFGMFMIFGYWMRVSSLILSLMSFCFVFLISVYRIKTGTWPTDCGCFGEGSIIHLSGLQVLLLDISNGFLGLILASRKQHLYSLDGFLRPSA